MRFGGYSLLQGQYYTSNHRFVHSPQCSATLFVLKCFRMYYTFHKKDIKRELEKFIEVTSFDNIHRFSIFPYTQNLGMKIFREPLYGLLSLRNTIVNCVTLKNNSVFVLSVT